MSKALESAKAPNFTTIFVCEKCGHNDARALKSELKEKIKSRGLKGEVKVVLTSCMDLCPKDGVSVALVKADAPPAFFVAGSGAAEKLLA